VDAIFTNAFLYLLWSTFILPFSQIKNEAVITATELINPTSDAVYSSLFFSPA